MNAKAPLTGMTLKDYNKDHSKNRGTKPGYETYRDKTKAMAKE